MSSSTTSSPASTISEESTTTFSRGADTVPHDESAPPAIPPKSPQRKSKFAGGPCVSDPIEEDIVSQTRGRVKRFTAALEEKPNLHIKQYTWAGTMVKEAPTNSK